MRIPTLSKVLLLGASGVAAAYVYGARRRTAPSFEQDREPDVIPDSMEADPADPVQGIDEVHEFHVEDLGVDAMSDGDAENDYMIAETEASADEEAFDARAGGEVTLDTIEQSAHDVGDLYGSHTPPAVDRTHAEDRETFDEGQNWLEALETSAAENGAEPERELDIVDDEDIYDPPHPSDTRDTPVADRGSGGAAGM